jgi:hypothetical protein
MLGGMHAALAETHTVPPGTLAPLPGTEAVLIGLAALVVMLFPLLWPFVEQFNAMAHEGAHAVVGSVMGFTLAGVTLDMESNGATAWASAPDTGPRRTLTRFVGYLGPSGFGLCAAKLIETGRVVSVLWLAIFLLVLLLFTIRKSFGILSVPAAIALLALVVHYSRDGLETVIIYGLTWLLLLSGVRVAIAHGADARDAANLSRTTYIPRVIWALLWLAGTVLAVVIGGKWLVLRS